MTKKRLAFIIVAVFCCSPMIVNAGEIVDVTDYGAVGDNTTYNDESFKNALDAVPANGSLFIPPGVYLLSDNWEKYTFPDAKQSISIFGTGKNTSVIRTNNAFTPVFLDMRISVSSMENLIMGILP